VDFQVAFDAVEGAEDAGGHGWGRVVVRAAEKSPLAPL
jgi:hypothetical protein